MAGTVTVTERTHTSVKLIEFDWLSDASGDATATTTKAYDGEVLALATDPDASPADPSVDYDVEITDDQGLDILAGAGADRSATAVEYVTDQATLGAVAGSKLNLAVSNAGNATAGVVWVWIR